MNKRQRRSKKIDAAYEVLMEAEFSGFTDSWTEHLCLERAKGKVILTSRSRELLCGASRFTYRDGVQKALPGTFRRKAVWASMETSWSDRGWCRTTAGLKSRFRQTSSTSPGSG